MSFILDALKRADAERAHGRVPGLHSQAIPVGGPAPALRQPVRPYLLLLSGVVIALLCLALWNWLKPSLPVPNSPDTTPPVAAISPPVPSAISPTPVVVVTPPETQASASPPAATTSVNRNTTSNNNAQAAMKAPVQAKTPAKSAAPAERPREKQAQPLVAAPTAPPASHSPALNELPENIRQALPKLVISGAIYSETSAHRMLIINGQVFHEGENPAPNLELEQIRPKIAIFNFKGQRYSMGY